MAIFEEILGFAKAHPVWTFLIIVVVLGAVEESARHISKQREPEIKHEQVIGNSVEETYIEIDGQKYYRKVDGIPVENYISES